MREFLELRTSEEEARRYLPPGIEWTMLIPEQVHLRIHNGANGGLWNQAWRQYMRANPGYVPREVLISKAFELALRFDIAGPIRPYYAPVPAPGPQLLAP